LEPVKELKDIIRGINVIEQPEIEHCPITHVSYDSRNISADGLFVAIKGFANDGHNYLKDVQAKGAGAAIVEKKIQNLALPQIVVPDSRQALARAAVNLYQSEFADMQLVGITGTNGKTTTSFLIRSVLEEAGIKCGLIGTIYYLIGETKKNAWNTTPESSDLCEMLAAMRRGAQKACVIEVSSHALSLKRVEYLKFRAGVFTNLTQDHLDFHNNLQDYFAAKQHLFDLVSTNGHAVINISDPHGRKLAEKLNISVVSFGFDQQAQVQPQSWHSTIHGLTVKFKTPKGALDISSSLIGTFNVENIAATIATALALNLDLETTKSGIEKTEAIPGRLESVSLDKSVSVLVDYSHTPDSLRKALQVLRELVENKLWVIFGCGGDRDRGKRPIMGKIAAELADHVVITSDNPRSEDPDAIISEIMSGIDRENNVRIESDRRRAIQYALNQAQSGDSILIAGKGHEDYQEINGIKYPFDDREIVREIQ